MKAKDILTRPLISITSERTMVEAAKMLVENNMGLLVICDQKDHNRLRGVVSERDIIRSVANGKDATTNVEAISTHEVVTVKWNSEIAETAKAMNKHRIRHVVVIDDADKPIGVISMRDLVGERSTLRAILQSLDKEVFPGGD
ncbi:MAG: CBS domain-containing protein [Candidatus Bathyarchaeia archaeon]